MGFGIPSLHMLVGSEQTQTMCRDSTVAAHAVGSVSDQATRAFESFCYPASKINVEKSFVTYSEVLPNVLTTSTRLGAFMSPSLQSKILFLLLDAD